jgi:hypothetical protein
VAVCEPGRRALHHGTFTAAGELLGLDLGEILARSPAAVPEPVFLVCTNGKHDPCCSEFGRPVYRRLVADVPDAAVFECSHIGGDRFAANIVCLPEGVYYGRVPTDGAADLVRRYRARQLELSCYRGRSVHAPPEQAAEIALRQRLGLTGFDAVAGIRRLPAATDGAAVRVELEVVAGDDGGAPVAPGRWIATLERVRARESRSLTCAGASERPVQHRVVALEPA